MKDFNEVLCPLCKYYKMCSHNKYKSKMLESSCLHIYCKDYKRGDNQNEKDN